ncbi:MAG: hypothetical protein GX643_01335 [Acidimicrobiales bacterium]|nr:hypothetical protein [Acidimicrobiales bacterium]
MALPSTSNGSKPTTSMVPAEWPKQAADTVVDTIAKVRDKTTKPALVASRALVYGIIIAVVGTIAAVVLLVGVIRLLDNYLPGQIWTIYLGFAVLFSLGGVLLLRKANKPVPTSS